MPPTEDLEASIEEALNRQSSGLARVQVIGTLMDRLERLLVDSVGRARAEGCSWEDIGAALGVSRQAAHQRFAKKPTV